MEDHNNNSSLIPPLFRWKMKMKDSNYLEDANYAGTENAPNCTLILINNDTLKSLVLSGLASSRDYYGLFTLKKDSEFSAISHDFFQALGLVKDAGIENETPHNLDTLRYGKLLTLTDRQGEYPFEIELLLKGLFQHFPILSESSFLKEVVAPVVKAIKGSSTLTFDSLELFGVWKSDNCDWETYCISDFNGWTSLTVTDFKNCFRDILQHGISLPRSLNDYYCSLLEKENNSVSLIDGLTSSQRRILHYCFQNSAAIRVSRLSREVIEDAAYQHRRILSDVTDDIFRMSRDFVGSNNINFLVPVAGLFGTRLQGGLDVGSPHETFVKLKKLSRVIFHPDDDNLLQSLTSYCGKIIGQPRYYCPIIPILLINGGQTNFPCYKPKDMIENIKRLMDNKGSLLEWKPWYKGFKGKIEVTDDPSELFTSGIISVTGSNQVEITELPIGVWTLDYKNSVMNNLVQEGLIDGYQEHHTDSTIRFVISLSDDQILRAKTKGLHAFFQLKSALRLKSIPVIDSDGNPKLYQQEAVLRDFYAFRLELYAKRKDYLMGKMKAEARRLANQAQFIDEVAQGLIVLDSKNMKEFTGLLHSKKFYPDPVTTNYNESRLGDYDYLMHLPVSWFTQERKNKLLEEVEAKKNEREILRRKTPVELWRDDLENFLKVLNDSEQDTCHQATLNDSQELSIINGQELDSGLFPDDGVIPVIATEEYENAVLVNSLEVSETNLLSSLEFCSLHE